MFHLSRTCRRVMMSAIVATAAMALHAGDAFAQGPPPPGTQTRGRLTRAELDRRYLEFKRQGARASTIMGAEDLHKAVDDFHKIACESPLGPEWQKASQLVWLETALLKIRIEDEAELSPEYLRAKHEEQRAQDAYQRVLADPRTAESERFNALAKLTLAKENLGVIKQIAADRIGKEIERLFEINRRAPGLPKECPAPPLEPLKRFPDRFNGFYAGIQGVFNAPRLDTTETLASTGTLTNQFSDSNSGFGAGVTIGYALAPFDNSIRVTPFVAADFFDHRVRHSFGGGAFLGETINFVGTAGVQLGYAAQPGLQIYALGGAALVNKDFSIDFGGPVTNESQWLWGGTLGVGVAVQPSGLQIFGRQVGIFIQYQHIFIEDGRLDRPAASPFFNYRFGNDIDLVKVGVQVWNPLSEDRKSTRLNSS